MRRNVPPFFIRLRKICNVLCMSILCHCEMELAKHLSCVLSSSRAQNWGEMRHLSDGGILVRMSKKWFNHKHICCHTAHIPILYLLLYLIASKWIPELFISIVTQCFPHSGDIRWTVVSSDISNSDESRENMVFCDFLPATWYQLKVLAMNDAGKTTALYDFATTRINGGNWI